MGSSDYIHAAWRASLSPFPSSKLPSMSRPDNKGACFASSLRLHLSLARAQCGPGFDTSISAQCAHRAATAIAPRARARAPVCPYSLILPAASFPVHCFLDLPPRACGCREGRKHTLPVAFLLCTGNYSFPPPDPFRTFSTPAAFFLRGLHAHHSTLRESLIFDDWMGSHFCDYFCPSAGLSLVSR